MQFVLFFAVVATVFANSTSCEADEPMIVNIWPGEAPDEPGTIGAEYVRISPVLDKKQVEVTESTRIVTNVTKPMIHVYRPPKETATDTAMLICPGGGYWNLYWELEGEEVASWLKTSAAAQSTV